MCVTERERERETERERDRERERERDINDLSSIKNLAGECGVIQN